MSMRNGKLRRAAAVVAGLLLVSAMAGTVAADGYGTWSINDASIVEGNSGTSTLTFTITYTPTPTDTGTVTVVYVTIGGTAILTSDCGLVPGDYVMSISMAEIDTAPAANHTATVSVTVCGDTTVEADETFSLLLLGTSPTTTITKGTGVGTIINDDGVTTTTLASSANPSVLGDAVTFTAAVSGGTTPTGTVTFSDGATVLGTVTMAAGSAALTTSSLPLGPNSITASYGGDATHATSTAALLQSVVVAAPHLQLQRVATPGTYDAAGQIITFSYTIVNDGNVPLMDPSVSDDHVNGGTAFGCGPGGALAPLATVTCTAPYHVLAADVAAGHVTSIATAAALYNTESTTTSDPAAVTVTRTAPATPTPFESFHGVTSAPSIVTTLPPTSTGGGSQDGGTAPLFVLLVCLGFAGMGLFSVEMQRRAIRR